MFYKLLPKNINIIIQIYKYIKIYKNKLNKFVTIL